MKSTQPPPKGCLPIFLHILRAWLDKCDPRPPTPCPPARPVTTFMPGHIGVLAQYPPDTPAEREGDRQIAFRSHSLNYRSAKTCSGRLNA